MGDINALKLLKQENDFMKKALSLLLALFVCLTLAACGEDKTNNNAGGMVSDGMSKLESGAEDIISGAESTVSGAMNGTDGATQSSKGSTSDMMTLTAKISAKEAAAAALKHAGLKEDGVTDLDVDLDRDNGRLIYEIDFNAGGIEYDYDIDAETGDVISGDKDRN